PMAVLLRRFPLRASALPAPLRFRLVALRLLRLRLEDFRGRHGRRLLGCLRQLLLAKNLAMRTIPSHFRARQDDLESEMRLNLFPHLFEQIAEKFLDPAAPQADHVGVFLLEPGLVIVLISIVMHEVQLIYEAPRL